MVGIAGRDGSVDVSVCEWRGEVGGVLRVGAAPVQAVRGVRVTML